MVVRAVFFDMDDTLVLTSLVDVKASEETADLASQFYPQSVMAQTFAVFVGGDICQQIFQKHPMHGNSFVASGKSAIYIFDWFFMRKIDKAALIENWNARFVAAPWDVTMQVPVPVWRARHWEGALRGQGVEDVGMAAKMQQRFDAARIELFQFEPGVKEMIAQMRADGLHTVIITNGHADIQRIKLQACRAEDLFDGILVGGEEVIAGRHEKPHPSIFQAACKLAGCKAGEAIHIGDNLVTDIQGGNGAGLKATIWVDRQNIGIPEGVELRSRPTFVVHHVTDLVKLMPQLKL